MRTAHRLKLDMSHRVAEFCDLHPDTAPAWTAAVADLKALLQRADSMAEAYQAAQLAVRAWVANKENLRATIMSEMEDLLRIVDVAALRQPDLAIRVTLPRASGSHRGFVTAVRVALAEATSRKELLLTYGMREDALDRIAKFLDQYITAVNRKHDGITTHVGATAELDSVIAEVMQTIRHIDALNRARFRGQADLLSGWISARNVFWPHDAAPPPSVVKPHIEPAA
jgi:hypothetical protein